ncbi:glycosyltransferase family 2 protein [Geojedonia litorea]|uniref:Glycosyltransferase family 2 protein n=1 Tax=Geojedonia litorea TaxID=1268269 RepID=A0ABV9N114_9FLAO
MKLSIVIVNYNVRYFLELCLNSVKAATKTINSEIIVVDNASVDGSCDMVKSLFPEVVLVENVENEGFSKANNKGVKIAKGKFICILNPDTVVAEDTFTILLDFAQLQNNLGILGCRLIDGRGHFLPESKRNVPSPKVAFKKLIGNSKYYYANQIEQFNVAKTPILVGAFMIMKKEIFDSVGGFDEDYFMYGEDIDLSYKIHQLGYDNFYNGTTTVIHFKGESTLRDKNYAKRFYGAMELFYKKHFKSRALINILVLCGVRLVYLFRQKPKEFKMSVNNYVLISEQFPLGLKEALNHPVYMCKTMGAVDINTEIILDSNFLDFKSIIDYYNDKEINKMARFKILPKNSNFILGSNSSKTRGDVIIFKSN